MKQIGFLCNVNTRNCPKKTLSPSVLNRAVLIDETLRSAGFRLFLFSPRHVSPEANEVPGYFIEKLEFVATKQPMPDVNGNWTGKSHQLINLGMGYRTFLSWAKARKIEIYTPFEFSDLASNKYKTYKLVSQYSQSLHPLTEQYDHSYAQIEYFNKLSDLVVLKPQQGNRGNGIILLRKNRDGYSLTHHHSEGERTHCSAASIMAAIKAIREFTADTHYIIQQGIETARYDDTAFDIRIIMINDGHVWHSFDEARVGAPGSDLSNISQGGISLKMEDVIPAVFGRTEGQKVIDAILLAAQDLANYLDSVYPKGLMEVAFDFMIDRGQTIHLAEINTKPGLLGIGYDVTVYDQKLEHDANFTKDVVPHTKYLARFLMTRMQQRYDSVTHSGDLSNSPFSVALHGASLLAALVDKQGRFKYRFDPNEGTVLGGYNVLRHCGTIWSMLDVIEGKPHQAEIMSACERAVNYLINNFLIFDGNIKCACIMEKNAIKLGGNALAILALLSFNKTINDPLLETIIIRLGDFMLSQQNSDGDFIHKKFFKSGKVSQFRSMYYTGEALLALIRLYEFSGEKRFLNAVVKCENLLRQQDYGVAEQSHWMLYFLEALSNFEKSTAYYKHAENIARHILDFPDYRGWGRSTPTACRSEGLLAFLRTRPPKKEQVDEDLRKRCLLAVKENLALQLKFRQTDGSFIRGGNDRRHTEVRIDYIQHNISSFLHYSRLA